LRICGLSFFFCIGPFFRRLVAGKTTFFVANQAHIGEIPSEEQVALEEEHKLLEEENKLRVAQVKALSSGK
jgi:hypothetical protein